MPLWLHIFNPITMIAAIFAVLVLNFGFMCIASFGTAEKKPVKFALSNLMTAFICAAVTISVGYAVMGCVFSFADEALQDGILNCDYSSLNVIKIPIISLCLSVVVGCVLSRFLLFKKTQFDRFNRTALCIAFALINLPYILILPVVK